MRKHLRYTRKCYTTVGTLPTCTPLQVQYLPPVSVTVRVVVWFCLVHGFLVQEWSGSHTIGAFTNFFSYSLEDQIDLFIHRSFKSHTNKKCPDLDWK